jgi:hypothetical protein
MATKAKTSYVRTQTGTIDAVRFDFADGVSVDLRLGDLPPNVLQECIAYAVREATRDTYSGESNPALARAALQKRWATMTGGQYASRGGSIDWAELIWAAVDRVFGDKLTPAQRDRLEASLEGMSAADLRDWLADPKRRAIKAEIDLIRAERKKAGRTIDAGTLLD